MYPRSQDREFELRLWRAGKRGLYLPIADVLVDVPSNGSRRLPPRWQAVVAHYHAKMRYHDTVDASGKLVAEGTYRTWLGVPRFMYRAMLRHMSSHGCALLSPAARTNAFTRNCGSAITQLLQDEVGDGTRAPIALVQTLAAAFDDVATPVCAVPQRPRRRHGNNVGATPRRALGVISHDSVSPFVFEPASDALVSPAACLGRRLCARRRAEGLHRDALVAHLENLEVLGPAGA